MRNRRRDDMFRLRIYAAYEEKLGRGGEYSDKCRAGGRRSGRDYFGFFFKNLEEPMGPVRMVERGLLSPIFPPIRDARFLVLLLLSRLRRRFRLRRDPRGGITALPIPPVELFNRHLGTPPVPPKVAARHGYGHPVRV